MCHNMVGALVAPLPSSRVQMPPMKDHHLRQHVSPSDTSWVRNLEQRRAIALPLVNSAWTGERGVRTAAETEVVAALSRPFETLDYSSAKHRAHHHLSITVEAAPSPRTSMGQSYRYSYSSDTRGRHQSSGPHLFPTRRTVQSPHIDFNTSQHSHYEPRVSQHQSTPLLPSYTRGPSRLGVNQNNAMDSEEGNKTLWRKRTSAKQAGYARTASQESIDTSSGGESDSTCGKEGCKRRAQKKKGLCTAHSSKRPRCTIPGCDRGAVKGGVCKSHGAKATRCSEEGCTNQAVKSGVCISHGATVTRCKYPGCNKYRQQNGVCVAHGAYVKRCRMGCGKYAVRGGLCVAHGARRFELAAHDFELSKQPFSLTHSGEEVVSRGQSPNITTKVSTNCQDAKPLSVASSHRHNSSIIELDEQQHTEDNFSKPKKFVCLEVSCSRLAKVNGKCLAHARSGTTTEEK